MNKKEIIEKINKQIENVNRTKSFLILENDKFEYLRGSVEGLKYALNLIEKLEIENENRNR